MVPMIAALALLSLCQEKFPVEDHAWLRYKPGSYIKNRLQFESGGQNTEGIQKLTLKEVNGDDYVISDDSTLSGLATQPNLYSSGNAVKSGTETLSVAGKEVACTVWKAMGKKNGEPTETRFW